MTQPAQGLDHTMLCNVDRLKADLKNEVEWLIWWLFTRHRWIEVTLCMFYQLLRVQHSCSSTQSWGSVLPSIADTRDKNSLGCPLLFSNRNLGSFMCIGDNIPIHPQPLGSCGPLQEKDA